MFCRVVLDISEQAPNAYKFAANVDLSGVNKKDIEEQINELKQRFEVMSINYFS